MKTGKLRKTTQTEPGAILAGALAMLVHVVFIALLIFGFDWKAQPPEGMVVDLWQDLPQPVQQPVQQPVAKDTPPPPPAQPKQQPKPAPQPQSEPKPAPVNGTPPPPKKPDIELKDKTEKPKPVKEDNKQALEEQKRKEQEKAAKEKAAAEQLQREQEAQKKQAQEEQKKREQEEQQRKELEAQKKREQEEKARIEAQQAAAAAARAQVASEIGKYKAMILAKIKSRIVMPPDLPGNPVAEFNVTLLPGGDILDVRLRKSSGYPVFDSAVERAILLSKPLPLPPDPALFNEFRNLHVIVHYLE
ncbi:cell envelope integrity protein TolA [Nitrosomonas sp.]|uniref:cell envelope integrity protein TolA n=1 Tax=Nitrosomonas sp. TaxID=42353 RepID=UPI002089C96C|nr:cell envelope integrity protein TolA [Nitrosomonas sp.]GJL74994.1 MAG: hypothetical protein NMNS02_11000 [Nitrosomonas sp.]